jgi:hypothetical protein
VAPAQLSGQRPDYLAVWEDFGELDHPKQVIGGKALPVFGGQLSGQRPDNLLPVFGSLLAEDIPTDPLADAPVEQDQSRIHRTCSGVADLVDKRADVGQQFVRHGRRGLFRDR